MANKRQKKKKLKKTVSLITNFLIEFPSKIDAKIKKDPWEARKKLLEMDEPNAWTFYFINKCNNEILKRGE